jgi:hypothetical protein
VVQTDLHALDGARHLRTFGHERLAGLVAYHSGARAEAELRGLAGEPVTLAERLADIEHRYGADHVVTRSVNQARPELERCIQQVEARMPSSAPP